MAEPCPFVSFSPVVENKDVLRRNETPKREVHGGKHRLQPRVDECMQDHAQEIASYKFIREVTLFCLEKL